MQKVLAAFMGTEECIMYSYDLATVTSVLPAFANAKDTIVCDEVCLTPCYSNLQRCLPTSRPVPSKAAAWLAPVHAACITCMRHLPLCTCSAQGPSSCMACTLAGCLQTMHVSTGPLRLLQSASHAAADHGLCLHAASELRDPERLQAVQGARGALQAQ